MEDTRISTSTKLRISPIHIKPMSPKPLTKQPLPGTTIKARPTELRVISNDPVPDLEVLKSWALGPRAAISPTVSWPAYRILACFLSCHGVWCMTRKMGRRGGLPGTTGNLAINSPSWMCRSVPQTPQVFTLICACMSTLALSRSPTHGVLSYARA